MAMSWFRPLRRQGSSMSFSMEHDSNACFQSFKAHWEQAWEVVKRMSISSPQSSPSRQSLVESINTVLNHLDRMLVFLLDDISRNPQSLGEDSSRERAPLNLGPILGLMLSEEVLEKIFNWSLRTGEFYSTLKKEQLKIYESLLCQSQRELLFHRPVLRPLLRLLNACSENTSVEVDVEVDKRLVILLNQLCVSLTQNTNLLECFFDSGPNMGPKSFLIFTLLIPFVHHREEGIRQQARDALLLCLSLSNIHNSVGNYIVEMSSFCPVLASGLSGLYSSLPRKLLIDAEDWHQLTTQDVQQTPELMAFLNSLEFCNAVVQMAHPYVQEQLLAYIYQGFIVPVVAPALQQNSDDEIIAATAYLDVVLRTISSPALIEIFLKMIFTADEKHVLETLIHRISCQGTVCAVTLSLFRTLLDMNCEDVMLELVFRYLIPCTHVMVSQRCRLQDVDLFGVTADKFLALMPIDGLQNPSSAGDGSDDSWSPARDTEFDSQKRRGSFNQSTSSPRPSPRGTSSTFPTSFLDYLLDAKVRVNRCVNACRCWCHLYNGKDCNSEINLLTLEDAAMCNGSSGAGSEKKAAHAPSGSSSGVQSADSFGKADVGPFLTMLLNKLETMMTNGLFINLQLTGVVSQLACYPQPLLRSFLLNHTLVFQPSVRTLLQVLGTLKQKLDRQLKNTGSYEDMMSKARKYLSVRDERLIMDSTRRSPSNSIQRERRSSTPEGPSLRRAETRFRRVRDMLLGPKRSNSEREQSMILESLESIPNSTMYRDSSSRGSGGRLDMLQAKNAVLSAIVLEEFLKELAAIALEHSVIHFELLEANHSQSL